MVAKLPPPPDPAILRALGAEFATMLAGSVLWRVHRTAGAHPAGWNELRRFGPSATARFDPHDLPPRVQSAGVGYYAGDAVTTLAEVFQSTRTISPVRGAPHLSGFATATDLELLDLTGDWPLHAGASHAINTGRRDVTRAWARVFAAAWPDLHGLLYTSSMTGYLCVALFNPGAVAFPAAPAFSEPLAHPGLTAHVNAAAKRIGYRVLDR